MRRRIIAAIAACACTVFGLAATTATAWGSDADQQHQPQTVAGGVPTSKDFLEWMRSQPLTSSQQNDVSEALALFDEAPGMVLQYLHLGDRNDATSLRNMVAASGNVLDRVETLRRSDGGSSTMVSLRNTIQAQLNANYSSNNMGHSGWIPTPGGENIAYGYADPTTGWYDEEKAIFDRAAAANPQVEACRYDAFCDNAPAGTGHYLNMVYPDFGSVGLATAKSWVWAYDAGPYGGEFTIAEYRRYLNEYNSLYGTSTIFTDVDDNTSHAEDIYWMAQKKLTTGWPNPDGTAQFRPQLPVTRQDYAAFLYRISGSPTVEDGGKTFTDVNPSTSHYQEIRWAASNGIINGYPDGTFRGMDSIKRQDAIVMLYRLAGSPDDPGKAEGFSDTHDLAPEFQKAVGWAKATGLTSGYPDGSFGVGKDILRQDLAAFLHRAKPNL